MNFLSDFIKSRYWRAVIVGVTTPSDDSWRIIISAAVHFLAIALMLSIALLEPNPHHWRVYLAWVLVVFMVLLLPLTVTIIISHFNRSKIDLENIDPKFRKVPDLRKDAGIAAAGALILTPIAKYILQLFGVEP